MTVYLVRAGAKGQQEEFCLRHNVVTVDWPHLKNLSEIQSIEDARALLKKKYPDWPSRRVGNYAGQLFRFVRGMKKDDLVVLPLKTHSAIAIGRVVGGYQYTSEYDENLNHTRRVEWLQTDIPRSAFDQDLLFSFGAFITVCEIDRNNAEERIRAMLEGKTYTPKAETEVVGVVADIERAAKDQIIEYLKISYTGHALASLVAELLKAQGYVVEVSEPGPDGGVDILAGSGTFGLGDPKLCVQVKSGSSPMDVEKIRSFQGTMNNFGVTHGLFVSWAGFSTAAVRESRHNFFKIRLWDADDLVEALFANYDRLNPNIQAELPLKRIWALVVKEEE